MNEERKFVVINYHNKTEYKIKNIYKRFGYQTAFRTKGSIKEILRPFNQQSNKYNNSGIYKLTCNDCDMHYIGQTSRKFIERFKEHIPNKNNIQKSKYAQHYRL